VGAILITIGLAALINSVISARFFVKQAESKYQAMDVAFAKMEEFLAKSYSGLQPGITTGSNDQINWKAEVKQLQEVSATKQIPYKRIEVTASYKETDTKGSSDTRQIKLENIIPYPFIHAASTSISRDASGGITVPFSNISSPVYKPIGDNGLKIEVNYDVPKDIMLIYNIAIRINQATNISSIDTILTGCFVDNKGPKPVVTRTPIMTQPLISNAIALTDKEALPPGPHTIEIKWFKDTNNGVISLREANLMLVAVEKE